MGNSVAATCLNEEEGAVDKGPQMYEEIGSYHGESEYGGDGVGLDALTSRP